MAPRWALVAHSLSDNSVVFCSFKKLEDLSLILDSYGLCLILKRLIVLGHHVPWVQKISDWVHVDLLERYSYFPSLPLFRLFSWLLSNLVEDLPNGSRYNALVLKRRLLWHLSSHGVSFATSSLPIGEDAYIKTVQKALNQLGYLLVDIILGGVFVKATIEVKSLCTIFLWLNLKLVTV